MVLEHVKQFIEHLIFKNLTYLSIYENICKKYIKSLIVGHYSAWHLRV